MRTISKKTAIRGPTVTFAADPFDVGDSALHYESDTLIVIESGIITVAGPYNEHKSVLPSGFPVTTYGHHCLILPGFIDAHVHYPQT